MTRHGGVVTKVHGGRDGPQRAATAVAALQHATAFGMPVPEVLGVAGARVETAEVEAATDGATLLGRAPAVVLGAIADFARDLHARPPPMGWPLPDEPPATWVHGDLCPVNLLFDEEEALVAVLDWEDSHIGDPLVDLAWTEWLVRTWHPDSIGSLPALYAAHEGGIPRPAERREAMAGCLRRHRDRGDQAVDWDAHLAALEDLDLSDLRRAP